MQSNQTDEHFVIEIEANEKVFAKLSPDLKLIVSRMSAVVWVRFCYCY